MKNESTNNKLSSFFATEYRSLIRYVKKYINERYYNITAEDIIQDVAVNIFNKVDFDLQIENIAGYFYRSIRNKISDIRRKKKNEILLDNYTNGDNEISFFESLSADENENKTINDNKFYQKLHEALEGLNPNQQAVIIAIEFDNYTYEELSEEWGIPIGTLLSWKSRGIKKLKEKIKLDEFYIDNEM